MSDFIARFTLSEEQEPIKATFSMNLIPDKLSQLENDMNFVTKEEVNLPDVDFDKFATKDELADKADDSEVVHLDNTETITGLKTFTQPLKIQNGAGTGSLIVGADVNANTLNNGTRKLARIAVPTQYNKDLMAILLGFDSNGDDALNIENRGSDNIAFGGSKKITNATSPMSIGFCVTKTRNSTSASDKVYVLEMDSSEARFNVQPNYNGTNLVTATELKTEINKMNETLGDINSILDVINGEVI